MPKRATPKDKAAEFRPTARSAAFAKELRARSNALSDTKREALFNKGMQLIYGGDAHSKAAANRR